MGWMSRNKRQPGWHAVVLHHAQVDLVHVKRTPGGKPAVLTCDSYRREESDAVTLRRLSRQFKLGRRRCTTLLPREDYQLHQIDAPNVPAAELKSAVRWRIKDLVDFPVETATVEVLDIPADSQAPAPDHAVLAVVAATSAVERCAAPFDSARVSLEAVDIPELAQRNIATLFEHNGAGVVTLAFYEDDGLLTFTRAGELYNARRIDLALPQLLQADDARRAIYFERIALELQRSLDHLGRQYHYVPIAQVLLGPMPRELRLDEYLSSIVSIPVDSIDLAGVLDVSAVPALREVQTQALYLQALGAALRDEEATAA